MEIKKRIEEINNFLIENVDYELLHSNQLKRLLPKWIDEEILAQINFKKVVHIQKVLSISDFAKIEFETNNIELYKEYYIYNYEIDIIGIYFIKKDSEIYALYFSYKNNNIKNMETEKKLKKLQELFKILEFSINQGFEVVIEVEIHSEFEQQIKTVI